MLSIGLATLQTKKVVFTVLLTSTFLITWYMQFLPYSSLKRQESIKLTNLTNKYLLYWTTFWGKKDFYIGFGNEPFKDCEFKNCFATNNRTMIPLEKYDALIFHANYKQEKHGAPWIRSPHQKYVFMNVEAPQYLRYKLEPYAGYFNWTMSYRFDSDIVRRHGYFVKMETGYQPPSKEFIQNKNKSIAWFVSHCKTSSKREVLADRISKHMEVDIYGACSKLQCQRAKNHKLSSEECYDMVERDYKFYLSFENSYCKDYSTEKLYNILKRNVIPVVYGFGDYSQSAPPNSVINVNNFKTVTDLTNYLYFLSENVNEYLKYFEWKKHYYIESTSKLVACQICKKLNDPTLLHKVYHNLHEWWYGVNNTICDFPNTIKF